MSTPWRIVGIMMVSNEDLHVERAIRNAVGFCDLLLVADHHSRDRTWEIVSDLAKEFPAIRLTRISNFAESHELIEGYAGSRTWVFGLDGDEVYDPQGLAAMRASLLEGAYADRWSLLGNVLHCVELDQARGTAKGYLAPPALSMTKLYNFSKISSWRHCPQRLHWGEIVFNSERHEEVHLCDQVPWEDAVFRCLHLAFLRRSSLQTSYTSRWNSRYNPSELVRNSRLDWSLGLRHVLKQIFVYPLTRVLRLDYKYRRYRKGPLREVDAGPFKVMGGNAEAAERHRAGNTEPFRA